MNLLLLFPQDFISSDRVRLTDRRLTHLLAVKKVKQNDQLAVGLVNDRMGSATVLSVRSNAVELQVSLENDSPPALPIHLILALPRPKMLKRIFQTISALGVKHLTLINSRKVEKSYWQSPWLEQQNIQQQLILGLEQAKDTVMPTVNCHHLFKPFVEDHLPDLIQNFSPNPQAIIAHPGRGGFCDKLSEKSVILAIGPEGGFIDYEIEQFESAGFGVCHLGERILRVETVIPVILGRLL